jgi:hypothetical protein
LVIYDLNTLAFLAGKHPHLVDTLQDITQEAFAFSDATEPTPRPTIIEDDLAGPVGGVTIEVPATNLTLKGHFLCQEINNIPARRDHAKQFEQKVTEALRYVFDGDLTAWSPQKASDSSVSFYDVVCRVASKHDFWTTIANQFRSRYIVFEFKNYGGQIKQGQIHTTEKYLYVTALRSTAIVISRKGADKNALAVCRGALRESGKLIINLTIDHVCEMLHLKDNGGDHNGVLVERVDEMLMRLER